MPEEKDMRKYCPMADETTSGKCVQGYCAWWIDGWKECAVTVATRQLCDIHTVLFRRMPDDGN